MIEERLIGWVRVLIIGLVGELEGGLERGLIRCVGGCKRRCIDQ